MYKYRATVLRWVDADTVDLEVDLGFNVRLRERFRLTGPRGVYFDAAEKRGEEREYGKRALALVQKRCAHGSIVTVYTHKQDKGKYGRWLATVMLDDVMDVATVVVMAGLGKFNGPWSLADA